MRVAFVTGGSGGLGLATANRLARDGFKVVVGDLNFGNARQSGAGKLASEERKQVRIDVASEASVAAAFSEIEREVGPVAVLAHFAGTLGGAVVPLAEFSLEQWERVQKVNATGTFLCLREMVRHLQARPVQHARIVAVASTAGQTGSRAGAGYSASKGSVLALVRNAARELAPLGITVNAVAPGPIDTPMLTLLDQERSYGAHLPVGRVGTPGEVAAAVSYLASVDAGFVTGATIDINGGLFMR
ncbi:SDR family NAD(P)-dependent oxidoreductase [Agrobacterium pusense]|uniref:SDR family NAD(P)-dependent oxidoreductase n=1 Tax=Agrobacterium pusense TaxID=648995 RepID=UPI003FD005F7